MLKQVLLAATAAFSLAAMAPVAAHAISLEPLGVHKHGAFLKSAAEIASYDPATKRLFVVNGEKSRIDILDISNPSAPRAVGAVDLSQYGSTPNSVSVRDGMVAAAVTGRNPQGPGKVVFFRAADATVVTAVDVGPMPDMVTFSPDGRYVVTANEGEPDVRYRNDPEGSVSVIDVSGGFAAPTVRTADLKAHTWESVGAGVAIQKKGQTFAQDAEPEYVAVSPDSRTAFVSLQEVNAMAIVDLAEARVTSVKGLGYKDWSRYEFDADDRDGDIRFRAWPAFGLYQPDAIAAFTAADGQVYVVSANEGDSKDFTESGGSYSNESRAGDANLDPALSARAARLGDAQFSGRLKYMNTMGDTDGDGDIDQLFIFGARSVSIWSATGDLVFDSGDTLEKETARIHGTSGFNANHSEITYDNRSDDKGPEPEGVAIGVIGERTYAFVGLERVSGIAIFDVTNPRETTLAAYHNQRDFSRAPAIDPLGDYGPEGVLFVPADKSPNGKPLLIVSNEVASTTRIYEVKP